jgi:hypothetical protein
MLRRDLSNNNSFKRDILWAISIKVLLVLFLVGALKIFKRNYPPHRESPIFRQIERG